MSQLFASINRFQLEWGLGIRRIEGWAWPRFSFRLEPFRDCQRFLRYPEPQDGAGYRVLRVWVILALKLNHAWCKLW